MKNNYLENIIYDELLFIPIETELEISYVTKLPVTYSEHKLHLTPHYLDQKEKEGFWIPWIHDLGAWVDYDGQQVVIMLDKKAERSRISKAQIIGLVNLVSGIALNLREKVAIHANAISLNKQAIGFAGYSGMGKSTLTAYCVSRGEKFITDDILTINQDGFVQTGNLRLKLFPHVSKSLGVNTEQNKQQKTHYNPSQLGGNVETNDVSLSTLYLLENSCSNNIYTKELNSTQAVFEVLQHSYFANEIIALKPSLLDIYIRFVSKIKIRKLFYPRNLTLLPQIHNFLVQENIELEIS